MQAWITPSILWLLLLVAPSLASSFANSVPSLLNSPISSSSVHSHGVAAQRHHHLSQPQNTWCNVLKVSPGGSLSEEEDEEAQRPSADNDMKNEAASNTATPVPSSPAVVTSISVEATIRPPPPPPPHVAASSSATSKSVVESSMMGSNAPPPGVLRRTFPNLPWHRLPNLLTYLRCLAIPVLVVLFYLPPKKGHHPHWNHVATGIVFGIASVTDWLDGYLARRWDITSSFGAFLDPVADKLMVSTSLILLTGRFGRVVAIPSLIILAREIAVSALREWMAQKGLRDIVKVGIQGKIKTALTMVTLTMLLFVPAPSSMSNSETTFFLTRRLYQPAIFLLYLCAVVTVTSGSVYFQAASTALFGETK